MAPIVAAKVDPVRRLAIAILTLLPLVACGGDDESFCDRAEDFAREFEALESQFEGDELPTSEAFAEAADAIEALAEDAPDEVEDDLRTMVDGIREIAGALEDVDFSDPAAPGIVEAAERMQAVGEDLEDASQAVEAYLDTECGISFEE
jgi:hypothetical protein